MHILHHIGLIGILWALPSAGLYVPWIYREEDKIICAYHKGGFGWSRKFADIMKGYGFKVYFDECYRMNDKMASSKLVQLIRDPLQMVLSSSKYDMTINKELWTKEKLSNQCYSSYMNLKQAFPLINSYSSTNKNEIGNLTLSPLCNGIYNNTFPTGFLDSHGWSQDPIQRNTKQLTYQKIVKALKQETRKDGYDQYKALFMGAALAELAVLQTMRERNNLYKNRPNVLVLRMEEVSPINEPYFDLIGYDYQRPESMGGIEKILYHWGITDAGVVRGIVSETVKQLDLAYKLKVAEVAPQNVTQELAEMAHATILEEYKHLNKGGGGSGGGSGSGGSDDKEGGGSDFMLGRQDMYAWLSSIVFWEPPPDTGSRNRRHRRHSRRARSENSGRSKRRNSMEEQEAEVAEADRQLGILASRYWAVFPWMSIMKNASRELGYQNPFDKHSK